jgi:hypothetical protein
MDDFGKMVEEIVEGQGRSCAHKLVLLVTPPSPLSLEV